MTWKGSKNNYEKDLLEEQIKRLGLNANFSYNKVLNINYGKKLVERIPNMMKNPLNVIIYNFCNKFKMFNKKERTIQSG